MRTLLNIIWVVFGGFWLFLGYVFFGVLACIVIITIPAGIASFRIAGYALWPFGREVVETPEAGVMSGLSNIIWFLVAGLWLAIGHITTAAPTCTEGPSRPIDAPHNIPKNVSGTLYSVSRKPTARFLVRP